jgi:WD40 repeat protein
LDTFFAGSASGSTQLESRDGEVRAVSFSPDGLLLAISRSDDELHIYDSRFMGRSREPMRRFLHWGDDYCLGGDRWGIVDAVWVDGWCGKGLGVITGGSDGEIFNTLTSIRMFTHLSLVLMPKKRLRSFLGRT